jgi:hypothetical protein
VSLDAEEIVRVVELALHREVRARRLRELELRVGDVLDVEVPLDVLRDGVAGAEIKAEPRLRVQVLGGAGSVVEGTRGG